MMMIMIILRLLLIIMIIIIKWWIFPLLFVSSPEGISHYNIPLNHYKIHSLYPINIPFSIVGWLVHHVGYIYIMIMMMIMIILRLLLIIMIIIIKWWIFPLLFVSSPEGISHYNIPLNHYKIHSLYPINIPFSIVGWLVHHVGYIYI